MNKKQFTHWLKVAVIGIALGLALQFVRAWTEPTASPPNGNIGAPINTSAIAQTKAGGITAGTLTAATVTGTTQFCLGTSCISTWPSGSTPAQAPASAPTCPCGECNSTYINCISCYGCTGIGDMMMCTTSGWVSTGSSFCGNAACGFYCAG